MVIRGKNKGSKRGVGEICDVRFFRTNGVVIVNACSEIKRKVLSIVSFIIYV